MVRRLVFWGLGLVLALPLVAAGVLVAVIYRVQPDIDPSQDLYALNRPPAFTFLDKDGNRIGHHGPHVGERVMLSELPPYVPAAFLAMEDRQFYEHQGIDPKAIVRALIADWKAGEAVQGGSTITQQLVKILFLTPERTIDRKIREIGGVWTLEEHLTKDQILELYLNRIYLGSGAYGVDGASRVYFGKSARDLTLAEAAMLAALTRAPSAFTPRHDLEAAQLRSKVVLDAMYAAGLIAADDVVAAAANPAVLVEPSGDLSRTYFFDAAAEEVKRLLPYVRGDLTVLTTFDPAMQDMARDTVNAVLERQGETSDASQAALVSLSPDGAIRALIGGRDYAESQFNRVTQATRQPGSSFKPFVYLAALEDGLRPWTPRSGAAINIDGYRPANYGNRNWGMLTLEDALVHSVNTVAVRVGEEVGFDKVAAVAKRLGVNSELSITPSLALGASEVTPLEMTGAFAAIANGGFRATPYSVVEVRNPQGRLVYKRSAAASPRVVSEQLAGYMSDMMREVVRRGTAREADIPGFAVSGKTGTSSSWRDAWFIGYTPQYVTGVWVGNDNFTAMNRITGGMLPSEIWHDFMVGALAPFEPAVEEEQAPAFAQTDFYPGDVPYSLADTRRDYWGGEDWRDAYAPEERYEDDSDHYGEPYAAAPPGYWDDRGDRRDAAYEAWRADEERWRREEDAYFRREEERQAYRREEGWREPVEDERNPYRQEWYLREQEARRYGYVDRGGYPPERFDQRYERERGGAPRWDDGRGGPVYSMEPVGR